MHEVSAKQAFAFIRQIARSFRGPIMLMMAVALVWAIDLSLRPYLLKLILNRVAGPPAPNVFEVLKWPVLSYLAMTILLSSMFRLYGYFVEYKMIPNMRLKIADSVFSHLLGHSHNYYQNNFSGSLANKVNDLTAAVPDILQLSIDRFFSHSLALTVAIFTLWRVNIGFALAMLAWVTIFVGISLCCAKRLGRFSDDWSERGSSITGNMVDILSNILSVRLFARRDKERAFFRGICQEAVVAEQKLQWLYFIIFMIYGYSYIALQAFSLYYLILGYQEGQISVGDFALVLSINLSIVDRLWELARDFSQFSKHFGKVTQALRTTTEPVEIKDRLGATQLRVTNGEIVFDKVKFRYKGTEPLFDNKSVRIPSGQKVGLVGYSGSGKTTFVNLILRLYEVTSGRILIDGQNIADVTQESLRQAIAMIPQDPSLFHRSLFDNIRYGRLDASDEEVIRAAKQADAHAFIKDLPDGYNSLVGERGVKLSGGQRQRIAITRAILKNAPILILDEATSQLDSVTESVIQKSLWTLMQGKTTIVVAHRLSTLLHMDRILVFDKGKIVEDGMHKGLLHAGGMYKKLWDAQVGGFLPES